MARGIWIRPPRAPGKPREVWISFRDSSGKRRREKIGEDSPEMRRLAKDVLRKREGEVVQGRYFPERKSQGITFGYLAEKWLALLGPQRSKSWASMMRNVVREFGDKRCIDIKTGDLQIYYNRRMAESSASTANRFVTLISSIFNRGKEWGDFYGENPARKVKRKPENAHRMRYLDENEIKILLEACDPRLYPLLLCALTTGMRFAEMFYLSWENIDLRHGTIHVLKSKSGKPREIPICSKLRALFESLGPKAAGPAFTLPYMTFRRLFDSVRKKLPHFRWHDLRHTFASHFVMKTGDLPALQKILGHATPTMTLRYAHLAKGHLQSEMEIFNTAIPSLRYSDAPPEIGHQPSHQNQNAESSTQNYIVK